MSEILDSIDGNVGFKLLNGEAQNLLFPNSFEIPSLYIRTTRMVGDTVQLSFIDNETGSRERMWVEIHRYNPDLELYYGKLMNDPVDFSSLEMDDCVVFAARHIIKRILDEQPVTH